MHDILTDSASPHLVYSFLEDVTKRGSLSKNIQHASGSEHAAPVCSDG